MHTFFQDKHKGLLPSALVNHIPKQKFYINSKFNAKRLVFKIRDIECLRSLLNNCKQYGYISFGFEILDEAEKVMGKSFLREEFPDWYVAK